VEAQVLRLKVLGGLSVASDGRPLSGALAQPKRLAVLALLARGGKGGMSRDRVINTLWPDVDEERARHTFNQTVYALRRALGCDDAIVGVRELKLDTRMLAIDVAEENELTRSSKSLQSVRNFLAVHPLVFPVERTERNGTRSVLWSDIRFCWRVDGYTMPSLALWIGSVFDREGRPLTQTVHVGSWIQQRAP